jgi:hypothetical protein
MRKRTTPCSLIAAFIPFACFLASDARAAPVITPQQIEADWLRQDELRGPPKRTASPATKTGKVTPEQDAVGGVDGHIDGLWGFHTAHEAGPWWHVDLGRSLPIERVLLYNRTDNGMHSGDVAETPGQNSSMRSPSGVKRTGGSTLP